MQNKEFNLNYCFWAALLLLGCFVQGCIRETPYQMKCYPPVYPNKNSAEAESYKTYFYQLDATLEEIATFYEVQLEPVSYNEKGLWYVQETKTGWMYECAVNINSLEVEQGCIYLHQQAHGTLLETVWYLSEGSAPGCHSQFAP